MSDPLFIAFYTSGDYAKDAKLLKFSLDALKLESEFVDVGPMASWDQATHRKPTFIREMQAKYPDRPLVYIDVDAIVLRKPELFWRMGGVDVAAYGRRSVGIFSGTIYFAPTDAARAVVDRWIECCARDLTVWDQIHFADAVHACLKSDQFGILPPTYCWPVGAQSQFNIDLPDEHLVIVHTWGSSRHNEKHK